MAGGSVFGKLFGKGFGKGFSQFSFKQSFKNFGKSGFGQSLKGVPKGVGAWSGRRLAGLSKWSVKMGDTKFGAVLAGIGILTIGVLQYFGWSWDNFAQDNNIDPEAVASAIGIITLSIGCISVAYLIRSVKRDKSPIIILPSQPIDSNSKTPAV
jgi:hypothetical protein